MATKKDSGEEILKAILEKGGQSAKGKEALEKAAAELQAVAKNVNEAATAQKDAAQKQSAAATAQRESAAMQKAASKPSEVSKLTQKIAGAPGASAAGVAGTVGAAIKEQTIGSAFSIKGMAAAMSESLGLKGLGLALGDKASKSSGGSAVQTKQLDTLSAILELNKDNKEILLGILDAIKGSQAGKIEAQREGQVAEAVTSTGAGAEKSKGGGFLKGLMSMASTALAPIMAAFSSIGGVIKTLASFVARINPITAILGVALAGLEREDWAETFENISKVFSDLSEGKFFDAIVRLVGTIGDALITGFGRLLATALEWVGLDKAANAIREFLNDVNLGEQLLTFVKAIPEIVTNAFNTAVETVKGWIDSALKLADDIIDTLGKVFNTVKESFISIRDKVVEKMIQYVDIYVSSIFTVFSSLFGSLSKAWDKLLEGDILGSYIELISAIPNAIFKGVGNLVAKILKFFGFEEVSQQISEFFETFDLAKTITDFGSFIKDTVVGKFNSLTEKVREWWDSFSIVEPIIESFAKMKNIIVEKISSIADGVTGFFKDLPSNLVNALPDGLIKNSLMKFIGGGKTQEKEEASNYEKYKELGRKGVTEFLTSDVAANPITGPGAIMAFKEGQAEAENMRASATQPVYDMMGNVVGVESARSMEMVNRTSSMATSSSAPAAPVVVNNVTNNNGGGGGNPAPRVSGAVSTAPASSHLDRALYGTGYGAGYP